MVQKSISNQQQYAPMLSLLAIISIIGVSIYNSAFKNGNFTCNRYILNSYLYILLMLILIMLQVLYLDFKDISSLDILKPFSGILGFILLLVLLIGIMVTLMYIPPRYVFLKHLVWLILGGFFGLLVYPAYEKSKSENSLLSVMFSLIAILVVFTAVAFIKPDLISLSWGPILLFILVGMIIVQVVDLIMNRNKKVYKRPKAFAYIIIVLFIFFLLYDTKIIQIQAKKCKTETADYINQSLGVILDAINLFQNLVFAYGN
tara:strand:+ start:526 stop:1305 length:780 start_codon:yes stop_codon:yes gene_type:complete